MFVFLFGLPGSFLLLIAFGIVTGTSAKYKIPAFTQEQPNRVTFYNSTGIIIPCSASGTPRPEITWTTQDNATVSSITGVRHVRKDGALIFSPFAPEDYRQDVHSATYRCIASNLVGTVSTKDVHVRGVLYRNFDVRVFDEFVIRGNVGVLRCNVPNYVRDYVIVTSWKKDDNLLVVGQRVEESDKYTTFSSGELHVRNVEQKDTHAVFKCLVRNTLTRETKESVIGGRFIITEPRTNVPPRLTHAVREIRGKQGEVVLLPCVAQGHPSPKYRWTRRNIGQSADIMLSPEGRRRTEIEGALVISHAAAQDSGIYNCVAFNEAGEVRTEVHLTVRATLKVSMWPPYQDVSTGSSVTINCTVSGYPVSSLEWMHNLSPVVPSRRVVLLGQTILHISDVQREDKGIYQCFARNDEESAQASAQLSIASEPPVLTSKFEELVVNPGNSVSIRCSAMGNPLPQITWYSYDVIVQDTARIRVGDYVSRSGNVISFVNISRIDMGDGGQYECRAGNEYGMDTFSAIVHVRGPPTIKSMANKTAIAGDVLVVHCPTSGYPIQSVRWSKGTKQLPLGRRQKVFANGTLIIQGLDGPEDEGNYHCQAENAEGIKAHGDVYLKVLVPPAISPFAFTKRTHEGMRASVTCTVMTGDPPIRIFWLKNGQPLNVDTDIMSHEMVDEFISTLVFKSLRQEHSGTYTCVAFNDAATVNYSAPLSVSAPPRWRVEPNDQFAPVGGMVIINCVAYGKPDPRVIWKKAQSGSGEFRTVISGSHIQTLVNGSLVIRDIEKEDDGKYMCEASNGVGSPVSTVVKLTVHVPPHFKQKFLSQTVRQGESVIMRCEASGEKPISYEWLKDRQPFAGRGHPRYMLREQLVNDDRASELAIHVVERQDNGLYTCVASNSFGQDEQNTQLSIQERPDAPTNLKAAHKGARSINIRWTKPYNGNNQIIKYILEYAHGEETWTGNVKFLPLGGDEQQANVDDLTPKTKYSFRLTAENSIGRSLPSIPLVIETEGEVPGGPPRSVKATSLDSRTIQVTWEAPLASLHHGDIRGYYIGYRLTGSRDNFVYKTVEVDMNMGPNSCDITDLRSSSQYSVAVQAYNEKGAGPLSTEVIIRTLEFDPPKPPHLKVSSVTESTITLTWSVEEEQEAPVSGYVLHWREHGAEWLEEQVSPEISIHIFEKLHCGTRYEFYAAAFNSMGKGQPSDIVSTKTEGTTPIAPSENTFITRNSTTFLLRLYSWRDGGCPITFFVIQYKPQKQSDWQLLDNRIEPGREEVRINELGPGTWYSILVSAHNGVGLTEVEYLTSTLTLSGATVLPEISGEQEQFRKYKNLSIIVPVASAVLVLVAISIAVFFLLCRKRGTRLSNHYEGVHANEDAKGDTLQMSDLEKTYDQSRESVYFPAPYATSRVPGLPREDSRIDREGCRSLHHHSNRSSDHLYDMPHRMRDENMRCHTYGTTGECLDEDIQLNNYAEVRKSHLQSITEEGIANELDYIIQEKLALTRWTPTHRWRSDEVVTSESLCYSPSHLIHHPQTLIVEGPELSDAECDRDFRPDFQENGLKLRTLIPGNMLSVCLAK